MNNLSKLSIWTGAGISMDMPTKLPSGLELMNFVCDHILTHKSEILKKWKDINNVIADDLNTTAYPRMEVLLSSIAFVERYFIQEANFMSGFESFNEMRFNYNHLLLASLLHAGATIFTANFDLCIEKAYEYLYGEKLISKTKKGKKEIIYKTINGAEIIHFHGTSISGKAMGNTLENITEIVEKSVFKRIVNSFKDGKINLFLGYSLSDVYDINSIFRRLYSNNADDYTGKNYICNHEGYDTRIEVKAQELFKGKVEVVSDNTTSFLKKVCSYFTGSVQDNIISNEERNIDWKELFEKKIHVTYELKLMTTIDFLNKLNIAIDKIDINLIDDYNSIRNKIKSDKRNIIEYHLAASSEYYFNLYGDSRMDEYHKKALSRRFILLPEEVDKLEKSLSSEKLTLSEISKSAFWSHEKGILMSGYIKLLKNSILSGNSDCKYIKEIREALKIVDRIDAGDSISLVLLAALFRYRMLADMVIDHGDSHYYKEALGMYYDIGTLEGVISTYIDKVIAEYSYKQQEFSCESVVELDKAKKIAEIIGSYKYLNNLKYYKFL